MAKQIHRSLETKPCLMAAIAESPSYIARTKFRLDIISTIIYAFSVAK
jgi:hypothetical protein